MTIPTNFNPAEPSQPIAIYSLRESLNLRITATIFMQRHPDILVDYRADTGNEGAVPPADALRSLCTELLAGAGPDVIALTGLPKAAIYATAY